MTLHGHTGPLAPHVFRFVRRADFREGDLQEHPECFDGGRHASDVVMMLCRWMASPVFTQLPMVVVRHRAIAALPCEPPIATKVQPMTTTYIQHILKYTALLARSPFFLVAAAEHLEAWVRRQLPFSAWLPVDACFPCVVGQPVAVPRGPVEEDDAPAGALDPPAGEVRLNHRPCRNVEHPPQQEGSQRAKIVYGCAVALHFHQGMPMAEAITVGEQCWNSLLTRGAVADVEPPGVARRGGPQALALAEEAAIDPEGGQGGVLDLDPR